ncbi:MAG: AraC family transcriptional regulator, partial [Pseudomonadota bacterium]
ICAATERIGFAAKADWGGATNPFLSALPAEVALQLDAEPEVIHILMALQAESTTRRCGAGAVLDRLGEVLLIRLLRMTIERGSTDVGLLAGLADPRLSRAIVAMHDDPGRKWQGDDLARHAGLSQSRFSELFRSKVGEPPAAYLRRWRMVLARQDAERGDRIQTIARRYGYGSPEALSRAFKRAHNQPAIALRPSV